MHETSAPPARKLNAVGLSIGLAGTILSIGAGLFGGYCAAMAFGHGADNSGVQTVVKIGVGVIGMTCGIFAIRASFRGQTAPVWVLWSMAAALFSAFGTLRAVS